MAHDFDRYPKHPHSDLEDPAFRELVREARLVFGYEKSTDVYYLFYGRESLEFTGSHGTGEDLAVLVIEYDQRQGDELERLAAAILALKGSCEYQSSPWP